MPLDTLERAAERRYDAERRRARVQVYLNSPAEAADWKTRAKAAGFSSVGTWIAHVARRTLDDEARLASALNDAQQRAEAAETEVKFLLRKVSILEAKLTGADLGYRSEAG